MAKYQTPLNPADEADFQRWVKANKIPFDASPSADYDMRGYWMAMRSGDAGATQGKAPDGSMHFPDTFKTPTHKTFSNESLYAPTDAPHWVGDRLIDKNGKVIADESPQTAPKVPQTMSNKNPLGGGPLSTDVNGRVTKAGYEKALGYALTDDEYRRLTMASDGYQSRAPSETKYGAASTETAAIKAAAPKSALTADAKAQAWAAKPGAKIHDGVKMTGHSTNRLQKYTGGTLDKMGDKIGQPPEKLSPIDQVVSVDHPAPAPATDVVSKAKAEWAAKQATPKPPASIGLLPNVPVTKPAAPTVASGMSVQPAGKAATTASQAGAVLDGAFGGASEAAGDAYEDIYEAIIGAERKKQGL